MTALTESIPTNAEWQALLDALRRNLNLLGEKMSRLVQEQVRVLLLDRKNRVVGQRTIYQGNGYCALFRPAEVFRPAVIEAVPQIVVVHNHPSGDPEPSREDIKLSKDLVEVGQLLAIELLDHVVIGSDGWASLKGQGLID